MTHHRDGRRTFVVAVDLNEPSSIALRQGLRLSKAEGTSVRVVYVIESLVVTELQQTLQIPLDQIQKNVREGALEHLQRVIRDSTPEGYPLEGSDSSGGGEHSEDAGGSGHRGMAAQSITPEVRVGHPVEEILHAVEDCDAELLVLARNSTSKPERGAGACAVHCVRKSPSSVLLVRPEHAGRFRHIVAGVDFSEESLHAARKAIELAHRDGAKLDLVHAYYPPWEVVHFTGMPVEATPQFQQQYHRTLESRLERIAHSLEEQTRELEVTTAVVPAATHAEGLVEHLTSTGADLAVLASHGRSGIRRLLLGSTAERVIRESPCSVLTVRGTGDDA